MLKRGTTSRRGHGRGRKRGVGKGSPRGRGEGRKLGALVSPLRYCQKSLTAGLTSGGVADAVDERDARDDLTQQRRALQTVPTPLALCTNLKVIVRQADRVPAPLVFSV